MRQRVLLRVPEGDRIGVRPPLAALLLVLGVACSGDSISSPPSTADPVTQPTGDSPSSTPLTIQLAVSSPSAATGDTIELRVQAAFPAGAGLSGLSGTIAFDPARLRFSEGVSAPGEILVAHEATPGQLAIASVAGRGLPATTSVLRFVVTAGSYLDGLRYQFGEAVTQNLIPIAQADVRVPTVDSASQQNIETRRRPLRAVLLADLAQPDSALPPPTGGYLYGDVNADGRISVLDAAIVAALASGDSVAIGYLPAAANVAPANLPGLGGPDDARPPGRNADGTYSLDLNDVLAIAEQAVGLEQPVVGEAIPERRFASLIALDATPSSVTLTPGSKKQFGVVGRYNDGGTGPITATWSATGGTISAKGLFTAGSLDGSFAVIARATFADVADTAMVTITKPGVTLVSVTVAPATATLIPGGKQQFTASAGYSDGSTQTISPTWSATGGTIGTTGLFTAGSTAGTFRVIAQATEGAADTAAVTLTSGVAPPPTLVSLAVTPGSIELAAGAAQQFTARGRFSDGSSKAIPAAWNATGGTVDATGRYVAGSTGGSFRVISTVGSLTDTAAVTITTAPTPPPPTSGAWLYEDFSTYGGNTATWKGDPHDWMVAPSSWMHQEQIHIDTQQLYNGHPTLRYDWPGPAGGGGWGGCNTDPAISASYKMPAASEIWVEAMQKFRSDFNDRGPGCNFGEYKFLLMLRGNDRMGGIGNGHLGSSWWSASAQSPPLPETDAAGAHCSASGVGENCQWGFGKDQGQYLSNIPGTNWDGQWHTYRIHVKFPAVKGQNTGVFEVWVDGRQVVGRYNRNFINNSTGYFSDRFTELLLGSNSNSGTLVPTQTWWGQLKVWTSNPGW